jgi:2'-5' RNA ligase
MSQQTDNPDVRVFFALWPSAAERGRSAAWQEPLRHLCGGRSMRREMLHATLVFVGMLEPGRLEALQLAAQEVSAERFALCFDEARYWGHNHIVYAAPTHVPQQLGLLVEALERGLSRHRFEFDRREYKPHVTLLRNAHWTDVPLPAMPPSCWQIGDFALVQSLSQDGVASYRVLARFPLASAGG